MFAELGAKLDTLVADAAEAIDTQVEAAPARIDAAKVASAEMLEAVAQWLRS